MEAIYSSISIKLFDDSLSIKVDSARDELMQKYDWIMGVLNLPKKNYA